MSRSGYYEDDGCEDQWAHIRWRGAVKSAMRGKSGQAFLKECLNALEDMPVKALAANTYEASGEYCTLGVLGKKRGVDLSRFDPDYFDESYSEDFGVNAKVLMEIIWQNDMFAGSYDANGNWLGRDVKHEKFGPPKHRVWMDRRWNAETQSMVNVGFVGSPAEDMCYYVEREELPYERHAHMVEWLKGKING